MGQVSKSILDYSFNLWYILDFEGPSYILFLYVFLYMLKDPYSAARQICRLFIVIMFILMIIKIIADGNAALNWIYSLIPYISLMQLLGSVMINMSSRKNSFSYDWKEKLFQCYLCNGLILFSMDLFCSSLKSSVVLL